MAPVLTYRTLGAWGAGKGANVTAAEVDANFYALVQALTEVEGIEPYQIASITIDGANLVITLEDAREFAVPIPYAAFTWRGPWADAEEYAALDLFTANDGLYMVTRPHETATDEVFNPDKTDGIGPLYRLLLSYPTHYDIAFFIPGQPGRGIEADGSVAIFRADRAFYLGAGLPGSLGGLEKGADVEMIFPIYKNATQIGTFTIGGSSDPVSSGDMLEPQTGVFSFAAQVLFAPGERLRIGKPDVVDTFARDLSITIAAVRGTPT